MKHVIRHLLGNRKTTGEQIDVVKKGKTRVGLVLDVMIFSNILA